MVIIPGTKHGRLTVIRKSHRKNGKRWWECKCDCGKITKVRCDRIGKNTVSCGCRAKEQFRGYRSLSGTYLSRIKRRNSEKFPGTKCNLTCRYLYDLWTKQGQACILSGVKITLPTNTNGGWTASLDRIDNSVGYIRGNVQWVHKEINTMRGNFVVEHFIKLCTKVAEHAKK